MVRVLQALLVILLALSAFAPHSANASAAAPNFAAMHHGGSHHAPAHDRGGCVTGCIGCALPDAPTAAASPAAFVAPLMRRAMIAVAPRGHRAALDPPPPRRA